MNVKMQGLPLLFVFVDSLKSSVGSSFVSFLPDMLQIKENNVADY